MPRHVRACCARSTSCRLNPQKLPAVRPDLAFNTAASFATNTNWQSYGGESTMSYLSQMVALVLPPLLLAGRRHRDRGRARARHCALVRFDGRQLLARRRPADALPLPARFAPLRRVPDVAGDSAELPRLHGGQDGRQAADAVQNIAQGPIASQIAIKMLGTNGGGYMNANAAHPFENPTPLSQLRADRALHRHLPAALTYYLGRMVKNQRHGWAVWASMFVMLVAGILVCWWAEAARQPAPARARRRPLRRQHGRQGGPLRHRQLLALRDR